MKIPYLSRLTAIKEQQLINEEIRRLQLQEIIELLSKWELDKFFIK